MKLQLKALVLIFICLLSYKYKDKIFEVQPHLVETANAVISNTKSTSNQLTLFSKTNTINSIDVFQVEEVEDTFDSISLDIIHSFLYHIDAVFASISIRNFVVSNLENYNTKKYVLYNVFRI